MIKSEIIYTKQVYKDFASYTVKTNRSLKFIYFCAAIILACAIVMFALKEYTDGVLYAVVGAVFACYGVFIKLLIRLTNKKNINSKDAYEFEEDKMSITSCDKNGIVIATTTMLYNRFFKVAIYKDYGYIYINKSVAYIVIKQNFNSTEEFLKVLNNIDEKIKEGVLQEELLVAEQVTPPSEEPVFEYTEPTPPPESTQPFVATDIEEFKNEVVDEDTSVTLAEVGVDNREKELDVNALESNQEKTESIEEEKETELEETKPFSLEEKNTNLENNTENDNNKSKTTKTQKTKTEKNKTKDSKIEDIEIEPKETEVSKEDIEESNEEEKTYEELNVNKEEENKISVEEENISPKEIDGNNDLLDEDKPFEIKENELKEETDLIEKEETDFALEVETEEDVAENNGEEQKEKTESKPTQVKNENAKKPRKPRAKSVRKKVKVDANK